jgi:hypothetical protein
MKKTHSIQKANSFFLIVTLLTLLSCSLQSQIAPQANPELEQTRIAMAVEQTSIAVQKATLQAAAAATVPPPPTGTPPPTEMPTPMPPTETALPPTATATLPPTPTAVDLRDQIRGANVLVYEDMYGNPKRKPYVHQAVSEMNFSGGKVIEVGDALGNFKEQLLSSTKWDLIIVAAEQRTAVQGEFWEYVYDQVQRGAAVVIEIWYLDQHYTDIRPLLSQCGLKFFKDWDRGDKYKIEDYAIYWLQPDHPYFQPPQTPVSLGNPNYLYWVPPLSNDAGDLLQIGSGGDAVLLGGTVPSHSSDYGVLGTCLGGTMVIQTFSSHDYKSDEVIELWKNSIRYTLTNHFQKLP